MPRDITTFTLAVLYSQKLFFGSIWQIIAVVQENANLPNP